jgi:hypothetical protein
MAEDEIIKHAKKAFSVWSDPQTNWKHKAKEIFIEIIIIVFAVSISIWLHNESESSKDRKEERQFLTGLKTDLTADQREMKGDSSAYQAILDGALYFRKVGAGQALNTDSLNHYAWIFFSSVRKQSRTSRFETLKGSGKLDIIENKELLNNIINLYQEIYPTINSGNQTYTQYTENRIGDFLDAHAKLDTANNITNWPDILHSTEFRMGLFRVNTIAQNIEAYIAGIKKSNEIINQIDAELK